MNKLIASLSLLSLLFSVGCQKDGPSDEQQGRALNFDVAISGVSSRASKVAFADGDQFGLWVVSYVKSDFTTPANDVRGTFLNYGNWFDNVLYTADAALAFTPASNIYYPSPLVKVDLYAVSPYDARMSNRADNSLADPTAYAWEVRADQSLAADVIGSDLMTAFVGGAYSGITPNPTIAFAHRLAKVNVNIELPETFQSHKITELTSVEVINTKHKATVNVVDTSAKPILVVVDNEVKDIKALKLSGPTAPEIKGSYKYEAIVIPQSVSGNTQAIRIKMVCETLGNVELYCYTGSLALEYVKGCQTAFNVTVEDRGSVTLGTPTIVAWGSTADVKASARRPARLFFETDGAGSATAVGKISQAQLAIDDTTYMSVVTLAAGSASKLECMFMQPTHRGKSYWLKSVKFMDKDGVAVGYSNLTPAVGDSLFIKKDPTSHGYNEVISTATFN